MGRKLFAVALLAAAAAAVIASRRRSAGPDDHSGNGAGPVSEADVRRAVDDARGRIRAEQD